MTDMVRISHKKLTKLLHETDEMSVLEEMARRIKLGLIPLSMVGFSNLSNRKLWKLANLSDCDWALEEVVKRMRDGRIPTRKVTVEEVHELYSKNKDKKAS